jgi:hypothetical protein
VQYSITKNIITTVLKKSYYITCGAYFRNTEIPLGSLVFRASNWSHAEAGSTRIKELAVVISK